MASASPCTPIFGRWPAAPWLAAAGAALVCYGMPVLIMAALSRLGKAGIIVYPARYLPPAPATMLRKTPH